MEKEMDKKLTDNDIKKALEDEIHLAEYVDSGFCNGVNLSLIKSALNTINRLEAENERLKEAYAVYEETSGLKKAKAEAYKEFADKLKLHAYHECDITGYKYLVVQIEEIDNLLKELVGEDNASKN